MHMVSRDYWDRLLSRDRDMTRIQICKAIHGRKSFPDAVVMIQNTRKKGHEQGKKTPLLFLVPRIRRGTPGILENIGSSMRQRCASMHHGPGS